MSRRSGRNPIASYLVALAAPAAATAITRGLDTYFSPSIFPLYFAAVMLAAWYGGFGSSVVAALVSVFASVYFFFPPLDSFRIQGSAIPQLLVFLLVSLLIATLTEALRAARERAETARVAASDAQERLAFLAEASTLLGSSLDLETTLGNLANLAVPYLADLCVVHLAEEGGLRRIALAHADPEKERLAIELEERYPPDPSARSGPAQVVRTGRPEFVPVVTPEMLDARARDEEHRRIIEDLRLRSGMVVPIGARGRVLGTLTAVMAESGRRFTETDLTLVEDLGRRAGVAVDNARLFQERAHAARILQESLLPPDLPPVPAFQVAARYLPGGHGLNVGGDFYDLFEVGSMGWAAVIGDVCGKGVEAAAVTGLARYTIRAAATLELPPSRVLASLNDAILRQRHDNRFATVAYALLTPVGDRIWLTLSCGGHPPPLILRTTGAVEAPPAAGALLGLFESPELSDVRAELGAGDLLVLYTDGLSEARGPGGEMDQASLEGFLASLAGLGPEAVADRLVGEALRIQGEDTRDDLALLVLQVGGPHTPPVR